MAASQGARCHRPLPHCGSGRSSRSVRPLRPSGHLLQLMPQPALSRSARATRAPSGWPRARLNCCPCLTFTSSSRCRTNSPLWSSQNKRLLYDLLFRSQRRDAARARSRSEASGSRHRVSRRAPYLGTEPSSIIRTSTTSFPPAASHPMAPRWIASSPRFFLPVARTQPRLPRQVRRRTAATLSTRTSSSSTAHSSRLAEPAAFRRFLRQLFRQDWVVYAKPPFGGPEHVLNYLARYTHRVAISNHRLVGFEHDRVSFRWKDYAHGGKQKVMTVSADEFLRRFLHPRSAQEAWSASATSDSSPTADAAASLARCRSLLGASASAALPDATANQLRCPVCSGPMLVVERMTTSQLHFRSDLMPQNQPRYVFDSS